MASKRFDPLKEKLRFSLRRNQQDAALEAQRMQVEALSETLERRARIAQLSQDKREADIDAVTKFREAKQKEAEKRAQARARLEGKKRPPALSPPSPINMGNPGASLGDAPFAMENFGMPGGPQPGGPGTAGNPIGAGEVGSVPPFLVQQTTRRGTSLQETMPGVRQFIPREQTTTRIAPNVLSAADAMRGRISSGRNLDLQIQAEGQALGRQLFLAGDGAKEMRQQAFETARIKYGPQAALRLLAEADGQIAKDQIGLRKSAIQGALAADRAADLTYLRDALMQDREERQDKRLREREENRETRKAEQPTEKLKRRVAEIMQKPASERTPTETRLLVEAGKMGPLEAMILDALNTEE